MKTVFIGGCPRSGTTLLGAMLGNLSGCLATPESQFKMQLVQAARRGRDLSAVLQRDMRRNFRLSSWGIAPQRLAQVHGPDAPAFFASLLQAYGEAQGRQCDTWIDHTPHNLRYIDQLATAFPVARFVHIIRDGRATAASILPLDWGPNDIIRAASWWRRKTSEGLRAREHWPERVYRLHYEALVADPEPTCRALCEWLGLDYMPEMHAGTRMQLPAYTREQHALVGQAPDPGSIDKWRQRLSSEELRLFEWYAGDLLQSLGYALESAEPRRPPTLLEWLRYGPWRDPLYKVARNKWRRAQRKRLNRRA